MATVAALAAVVVACQSAPVPRSTLEALLLAKSPDLEHWDDDDVKRLGTATALLVLDHAVAIGKKGRAFLRRPTPACSAVPISSDGYYVTANHCLDSRMPLAVVLVDRRETGKAVKLHPRTVWRPGPDTDVDVALFKLDIEPPVVLPMGGAAVLRVRQRIASGGWSGLVARNSKRLRRANAQLGWAWEGEILSVAEARNPPEGSAFRIVRHDTILGPGDSGGPVIDVHNRLIGINVGGSFHTAENGHGSRSRATTYTGAKAVALDAEWLHARIEHDRARNPGTSTTDGRGSRYNP